MSEYTPNKDVFLPLIQAVINDDDTRVRLGQIAGTIATDPVAMRPGARSALAECLSQEGMTTTTDKPVAPTLVRLVLGDDQTRDPALIDASLGIVLGSRRGDFSHATRWRQACADLVLDRMPPTAEEVRRHPAYPDGIERWTRVTARPTDMTEVLRHVPLIRDAAVGPWLEEPNTGKAAANLINVGMRHWLMTPTTPIYEMVRNLTDRFAERAKRADSRDDIFDNLARIAFTREQLGPKEAWPNEVNLVAMKVQEAKSFQKPLVSHDWYDQPTDNQVEKLVTFLNDGGSHRVNHPGVDVMWNAATMANVTLDTPKMKQDRLAMAAMLADPDTIRRRAIQHKLWTSQPTGLGDAIANLPVPERIITIKSILAHGSSNAPVQEAFARMPPKQKVQLAVSLIEVPAIGAVEKPFELARETGEPIPDAAWEQIGRHRVTMPALILDPKIPRPPPHLVESVSASVSVSVADALIPHLLAKVPGNDEWTRKGQSSDLTKAKQNAERFFEVYDGTAGAKTLRAHIAKTLAFQLTHVDTDISDGAAQLGDLVARRPQDVDANDLATLRTWDLAAHGRWTGAEIANAHRQWVSRHLQGEPQIESRTRSIRGQIVALEDPGVAGSMTDDNRLDVYRTFAHEHGKMGKFDDHLRPKEQLLVEMALLNLLVGNGGPLIGDRLREAMEPREADSKAIRWSRIKPLAKVAQQSSPRPPTGSPGDQLFRALWSSQMQDPDEGISALAVKVAFGG